MRLFISAIKLMDNSPMDNSAQVQDLSSRILITGHRNPDTDSVCAAAAYAELKNILTKSSGYAAIRCGNINEQTQFVFEHAASSLPPLVTDVRARAHSVARNDIPPITGETSIFSALRTLDTRTLSILPVIDSKGNFEGLLSIDEIAEFFVQSDINERPVYRFLTANFGETVPGVFFKRGMDEFTAPIMIGAMPYDTSIARINSIKGGLPLLITGVRPDILEYAVKRDFPAIVLTGCEDGFPDELFSDYRGSVYISHIDTAETVRRLRISTPVSSIVNRQPLTIASDALFTFARDTLVNSHYRGLPVMNGSEYGGIVTRRCFITMPRQKLILVDHNELSQSVTGADAAEIVEIIDHHRLGAATTMLPILIDVRPEGSTCTIVYSHYCMNNLVPSKSAALLLLSGILSDTVRLKSPTTTQNDRNCAASLANLVGVTIDDWGAQLFAHTSSLVVSDYRELVLSDFKIYTEKSVAIGIGQVEVSTFQDYDEAEESIMQAIESIRIEKALKWAMLLVTNVMREESILVMTEAPLYQSRLSYEAINAHSYRLKGVLSRKKQLLPEILRAIHEASPSA